MDSSAALSNPMVVDLNGFLVCQPRLNCYINRMLRSLTSSPVPFNDKFSSVRLCCALSPATETEPPSGGRSGALSLGPKVIGEVHRIDVNPPKGTPDFAPEDMRLRNRLFNNFKEVSRQYGFEEVDFPVLDSEALFIRIAGDGI